MENQPIARLNFTCNRNWEDMKPVESGRFCNDCQKKVVDFTDKTNDEIAAYIMSSTTKVCGRFQQSQLVPAATKPVWKRLLSAAAMFVTVFIGIKEASAQQVAQKDTVSKSVDRNTSFGTAEKMPTFPGGEKAFNMFLHNNIHPQKGIRGRLITSFIVEKDGSLTDIKVLRGLSKEVDDETIRVLTKCPKWQPGIQNGVVVRQAYTMPVTF